MFTGDIGDDAASVDTGFFSDLSQRTTTDRFHIIPTSAAIALCPSVCLCQELQLMSFVVMFA